MVNTRSNTKDRASKMTREERIAAKRATLRKNRQQRSDFDSPWGRELKSFKTNEGRNRIRILPFPGHDHYALPVQVHYGVGPDNSSYLCLKHNDSSVVGEHKGHCPICDYADTLRREAEEIKDEARRDAAKKEASRMRSKERRLVLLVDREKESDGIQFWAMPFSIDEALIDLADDPDTGEVLFIEDLNEGHDVAFRRDGQGIATRYSSEQIKPQPSVLSDSDARMDEWMSQLDSITIESLVNVYDKQYLSAILHGEAVEDPDVGVDATEDEEAQDTPSPARKALPDEPKEVTATDSDDDDDDDDDLWGS